jgi:antagonist of KipI
MNVRITKSGLLDTLQDEGRFGYAKWGINTNGVMDLFAMAAANALVANDLQTPVIEMHFPAGEVFFSAPALIAIAGADFSPAINGIAVPRWKSVEVAAGSLLTFSKKTKGVRCYLSIHGGFDIASWLGSASTNLKSMTGGFNGRALKKNDLLEIKSGRFEPNFKDELKIFPWSVNSNEIYNDQPVMITRGKEWEWLTTSSQDLITSARFAIAPNSDRMALFLQQHEVVQFQRTEQLLSSAVSFGTIQALPSGNLCVLMADHQTTGGYARVAHVISAHHPRLAQITPGEEFSFKETSIEEAEKMLFSLRSSIIELAKSLKEKLFHHYGFDRS